MAEKHAGGRPRKFQSVEEKAVDVLMSIKDINGVSMPIEYAREVVSSLADNGMVPEFISGIKKVRALDHFATTEEVVAIAYGTDM